MLLTSAAAGFALAGEAGASPLPAAVARMIDAAASDHDTLQAVVRVAKSTNPDSIAEIDAQVEAIDARRAAARHDRLANQGLFEGWRGKGEAGGAFSTGNSQNLGVSLGLDFAKETLKWRHAVNLAANYQRADGDVSQERYAAGYAGNYKFSERGSIALALSAERDEFAGYRMRLTQSLGIGYRAIARRGLKLDLDAGPALRETALDGRSGVETTASFHAGGQLAWRLASDLSLTEEAGAYLGANSTITSVTALTTKIRGAISGRASYEVRYQADPPPGSFSTDTTGRVSLVYSF